MKKNILIITYSLGFGGVENALINMLKKVDLTQYNIDLLLTRDDNIFIDEIPKEVNIIIKKYIPLKEQFKINLKKLNFIKALKILKIYLLKQKQEENKLLIKSMDINNEKTYDYAIAYHSFFQLQYINSINAKYRITFVHCDPYRYRNNIEKYLNLYEKSDLICCVSSRVKERLIEIDNKLKEKSIVMTNLIDVEKIKKLSDEGENFNDDFDGTRIVTLGRLTVEKGYELVIDVLKKLVENNYNIRWYILGDGNFRNEFENKIKEYSLQKNCIVLGCKKNPYTYLKNADIYVQPSLAESYCITSAEAKIFNLPIVRTNTGGVTEQFENMKTGIITEITTDGIYEGIVKLLDDENLKKEIVKNLIKESKNSKNIDQISEIIEKLDKMR